MQIPSVFGSAIRSAACLLLLGGLLAACQQSPSTTPAARAEAPDADASSPAPPESPVVKAAPVVEPGEPPVAPEKAAAPAAPKRTANVQTQIKRGVKQTGVPTDERVAQIAQYLQPQAAGVGRPITDREAWETFPNRKGIIALAEREMDEPIPQLGDDLYMDYSVTGQRKPYQDPYRDRTKRLADFTLAECMENQGRFLPVIEKELDAILSERTWTIPSSPGALDSFNGNFFADLGSTMRSWNVSTVDYLLGDKLRPETRERIRTEVRRRVLEPYRQHILGNKDYASQWWIRVDHNWNAVCHAGTIGSALALLDDPKERAWYLAAAELYIGNFLSGFEPSGFCSEGVGYWSYGFGHFTLMATAVGEATGWQMDFFSMEDIPQIATFPQRIEIMPGTYPSFSDNVPTTKPSRFVRPLVARHVPGLTAEPLPVTYGVPVHPLAAMLYQAMIQAFPGQAAAEVVLSDTELPLRDEFEDAGVVICRPENAKSGKGLAIALKAGHNDEHHNHNDVGTYVAVLNGKPLLVDPGMVQYDNLTWGKTRYNNNIMNSYGHSVPVVAGKLQDTGREAHGTVTVLEETPARDSYRIDLKPAYAQSVPSLQSLTRHMTYERTPRQSIEMIDEAVFDSPQTFEDGLLTFGKVRKEGPNALVVYDGSDAVRVTIDTGGRPFTIKEESINSKLPSGKKPTRLGIVLSEPAEQARIAYRIEAVASPNQLNPVLPKDSVTGVNPDWKGAVTVEGEEFREQKGGTVELTGKHSATNGTALRMWNSDGHELAWTVPVPRSGNYGVLLRYCNGEGIDAQRALSVDGLPPDGVQGAFSLPATGGWSGQEDDWKDVWLAQSGRVYILGLEKGDHTLSLRNVGGGAVNLDWIALVPLQ